MEKSRSDEIFIVAVALDYLSPLGFEFLAGAINISPLRGSGEPFHRGWEPFLTVGLLPRRLTLI